MADYIRILIAERVMPKRSAIGEKKSKTKKTTRSRRRSILPRVPPGGTFASKSPIVNATLKAAGLMVFDPEQGQK